MKEKTLSMRSAAILAALTVTSGHAQQVSNGSPDAGASAGADSSMHAAAPQKLEEIVVTSQRKAERTKDIPIAIQVINGEGLAQRNIVDFGGLNRVAPGFRYAVHGSNPAIALRGAGGQVRGLAGDPSVAISIDGVPFASQTYLTAGFLDVGRVEVLRGPQGTVAGRNSTGGAINIISNRPTDYFDAALNGTFGNYGKKASEGFVSGPLVKDVVNARVAFRVNYRDGILQNVNPANPGRIGADASERAARLSLESAGSGPLKALFSIEGYQNDTSGAPMRYEGTNNPNGVVIDPKGVVVTGSTFVAPVGPIIPVLPTGHPVYGSDSLLVDQLDREGGPANNLQLLAGVFRLQYSLGNNWRLTSTSGFREYESFIRQNVDASVSTSWAGQQPEKAHQFSEEGTITGKLFDNLDVLLGGIHLVQHGRVDLNVHYYPPSLLVTRVFNGFSVTDYQDLRSDAVFGQINWKFLPKLQLTVGGRYTHDNKAFAETAFELPPSTVRVDNKSLGLPTPLVRDFYAFTPRIALDYKPGENATIYTSYAKGFKSGGFNLSTLYSNRTVSSANLSAASAFNPEKVSTYEVGAKTSWFSGALSANLDGFYSELRDLQTQFRSPVGTSVIGNASSANVKGVELEVDAHPTDALKLGFNATYLDAKYDKFCPVNNNRRDLFGSHPQLSAAQCGLPPGTILVAGSQNQSGMPLPYAPSWSGVVTAAYTLDLTGTGKVTFDAAYNFTSRTFFSQFSELNVSQPAYGVLDLRATYETRDGRWSISPFVTNVTDTRYLSAVTPNPVGLAQLTNPANRSSGILGAAMQGAVGDPRMFGVTIGYHYGAQ